MYTKEHARENGQMLALAKELLGKNPDAQNNIYDKIAECFPNATQRRVNFWIDKAERELRGEKVRRRGAPPGNQNAKKSEVKPVFSVRLPEAAIARLKGQAEQQNISISDYIEMLSQINYLPRRK